MLCLGRRAEKMETWVSNDNSGGQKEEKKVTKQRKEDIVAMANNDKRNRDGINNSVSRPAGIGTYNASRQTWLSTWSMSATSPTFGPSLSNFLLLNLVSIWLGKYIEEEDGYLWSILAKSSNKREGQQSLIPLCPSTHSRVLDSFSRPLQTDEWPVAISLFKSALFLFLGSRPAIKRRQQPDSQIKYWSSRRASLYSVDAHWVKI